MRRMEDILDESPIIMAINNETDLKDAIQNDGKVVFILKSTLLTLESIVRRLKEADKIVFIHVDLIEGLTQSKEGINYIMLKTEVDGIISTKNSMIKYAKEKGLYTIQRFFLLDSSSFLKLEGHVKTNRPHGIEILPGVMPKVLKKVIGKIKVPVIAGGLISDKEDVMKALEVGARGVSTTKRDLWGL